MERELAMGQGKSCLVLGDINMDLLLQAGSVPLQGAQQLLRSADLRLGGSGCVTALALHALGVHTLLFGSVGDDALGDFVLENIRKAGMDGAQIQRLPGGQSGFFVVLFSFGSERTLLNTRGVNTHPLPLEILKDQLKGCAHVHISGYLLHGDEQYETVRQLAQEAFSRGLSISLDPGVCSSHNQPERVLGLLPYVSFFLPNRTELAALTGKNDVDAGLRMLLKEYCGGVALKLDAQGSRYADGRMDISADAEHTVHPEWRDASNAGDGFNAGFLHAILHGKPPAEALTAGNAMAARLLQAKGGVMGIFQVDDD